MLTLNVTGTADQDAILEALSLIDGITVEIVHNEPRFEPGWEKLPKTGTQRQATLLHFIREGRSTRDRCKLALGLGSHSDCATRVTELIRGGFLRETDETWLTNAGDRAAVVEITDKARKLVKLARRDWFPLGVRIDPAS